MQRVHCIVTRWRDGSPRLANRSSFVLLERISDLNEQAPFLFTKETLFVETSVQTPQKTGSYSDSQR
jgi:hypothetical protein